MGALFTIEKSKHAVGKKKKKRKERNANTDPNGYLVSTNTTHAYCNNTWNRLYRDVYTHSTHNIYREPTPNLYYLISSTKETFYKLRELQRIFLIPKYTLLLIPPTALGLNTQN